MDTSNQSRDDQLALLDMVRRRIEEGLVEIIASSENWPCKYSCDPGTGKLSCDRIPGSHTQSIFIQYRDKPESV